MTIGVDAMERVKRDAKESNAARKCIMEGEVMRIERWVCSILVSNGSFCQQVRFI